MRELSWPTRAGAGFRRTASPADKAHLLKLAEAWLDLAKLTRTQSGQHVRKIGEYPLVIAKLGDRDQRAA
jgi:hypothetical protein